MNYSSDSLKRARVCEAAQERFCLRFEDGGECWAVPAGALRWSAELPVVGDWVRARRADATLALIENVEPRTTCFSRQRPGGSGKQVLAANVDLIAIVITDAAWALLSPLLPPPRTDGRQRTTDLRAVLDAIFYLLRTGCQWRLLLREFPACTRARMNVHQ